MSEPSITPEPSAIRVTWKHALTTVPALNADQWQALSLPLKWLISVRGAVLFMTLMAAAFGGLLAWRDDNLALLPFLLCVIGLCLAHATNNLLNDYTDAKRGIDAGNYYRNQYGIHPVQDGLLSERQFLRYLFATGLAAVAVGLALVLLRGGLTLPLMAAGAFFVLFYTWPLKYWGLGEPAVLIVWGPLMVGGCYYISAGSWSNDAAWLGALFGLGPTTVLFGKHIDKAPLDRAKSVYTLPVLLGDRLARRCTQLLLLIPYLGCFALVLAGREAWPLLLVGLALPQLLRTFTALNRAKPETRPVDYPEALWPLWFSARTFAHTRVFSSCFVAGVLAGHWI